MEKRKNSAWTFFASTKLALFMLIILAIASVIGTLIPQKETPDFYFHEYGARMARLFELLDIPNMYGSWWFVFLLAMLSMNLIICTLDRLPNVWRLVRMNNLEINLNRLEKMEHSSSVVRDAPLEKAVSEVKEKLAAAKWSLQEAKVEAGVLLFTSRGSWTRLGVYVVHMSILIIFVGAIIGSVFGYKGFVMLPEGAKTAQVYKASNQEPIPLDFEIYCDDFSLSFYETGAPKEFRSQLKVFEGGEEKLTKSIVVNDPLTYKGITFYQASYQGYPDYRLRIENQAAGIVKDMYLQPRQQKEWSPGAIGILNTVDSGPSTSMLKMWFSDGQGEPDIFWLSFGEVKTITRPSGIYSINYADQRFGTGLQVAKDPGVWYVYAGCTIMLLGFVVAFFLSHQRIWVLLSPEHGKTRILIVGTTNKNKYGFEQKFSSLAEQLRNNP